MYFPVSWDKAKAIAAAVDAGKPAVALRRPDGTADLGLLRNGQLVRITPKRANSKAEIKRMKRERRALREHGPAPIPIIPAGVSPV